jgi:hypothetical protein
MNEIDKAQKALGHAKVTEISAIVEGVAECVREYVERKLNPLIARLDAVEKATAAFKFCGVWNAARAYQRGNFVSHSGAMWHCEVDSAVGAKPGDGGDSWRLTVKSGQVR